jgi:hypothetical protein
VSQCWSELLVQTSRVVELTTILHVVHEQQLVGSVCTRIHICDSTHQIWLMNNTCQGSPHPFQNPTNRVRAYLLGSLLSSSACLLQLLLHTRQLRSSRCVLLCAHQQLLLQQPPLSTQLTDQAAASLLQGQQGRSITLGRPWRVLTAAGAGEACDHSSSGGSSCGCRLLAWLMGCAQFAAAAAVEGCWVQGPCGVDCQ